jgi:hypothetical protein
MKGTEDINALKAKLAIYEESPLVEGYLAILKQINTWNKDLKNEPTSLKYNPDNGDADMKAFDKAHKFISSIDTLYDKLEYIRGKMNPEQQKTVDTASKRQEKSGTKAI